MKGKLFTRIVLLITCLAFVLPGNAGAVNYDESKVPDYVLPDVLACDDGTKVTSSQVWEEKRRPELLEVFSNQVYGYTLQGDVSIAHEIVAENPQAIDGLATAQQVMFTFSAQGKTLKALALVYIPNNRKAKAPVFVGYNFQGNHSVTKNDWVLYSPYFENNVNQGDPKLDRGAQIGRWPLKTIVGRGYAVVTMCYNDIYPDNANGEKNSIVPLLPQGDAVGSDWSALGAWAWGYSRIADWVEAQPWADKEKLSVIGHSRLGKAALWAGAQDERFKVVISNNSGCGGAALSKREFGETISTITESFPHWFCENFTKYSNNEKELPFDQHALLALIAPRHLYVASAEADQWADPKGEFLSAYHATPVYELYGMKGLPSAEMPGIHKPIMNDVGYHIRSGAHGITDYDWGCYLAFSDKVYGTEGQTYKDGISETTGEPDPEYKQPNAEGFYELGTAADLNWFATMVNKGNNEINAVLTADIDNYTGAMIGNVDVKYAGTFDGQFHKITYYTEPTEAIWGLFRKLSGTVMNLHVSGTITTSQKQCGGLAGFIYAATIKNCISSVNIISSFNGDSAMGGLVSTTAEVEGNFIENSMFCGTIQGEKTHSCGGLIGWTPRVTTLTNCLVIGEITTGTKDGNVIARNPSKATMTNCYYLNPYGSAPGNVTKISQEQLQNGEVCYWLNGNQKEIVWTQALGQDGMPLPNPSGTKVYAHPSDGFRCDGTPLGTVTYANTPSELTIPAHEYADGACVNCGEVNPDYVHLNENGFYELKSAKDLEWFAEKVNQGETEINAVLMDDIEDYTGPVIGSTEIIYAGTFDGQYHKLNYTTTATESIWGLFRSVSGTVKNLHVSGTLNTNVNQCGGVVGDLFAGTIENCISTVNIISTFSGDAAYGGFISRTRQPGSVIKNCVFAGTIQGEGAHSCAGISGWTPHAATLTNCLVIGDITTNSKNGDTFARNSSKVERINCYYLKSHGSVPGDVTKVGEEQLMSGEAGFLLNGKTYENPGWFQCIGDDAYPVPVPERGVIYNIKQIYGNAYDEGSFQAFKYNVLDAEADFIENVVAQASLVEEYQTAVDEKLDVDNITDFLAGWAEIEPIYAALLESEQAYSAYKAKVDEVSAELEKNENLQNALRDKLEYYFNTYEEPSATYSNGTALYILEMRLLNVDEINAEIAMIEDLYNKALTSEPNAGTDLTKLMVNPDFSDGFNGWEGEKATAIGESSSTSMRVVQCSNVGMDMYQTISGLQNGIYEVQINGAFRPYPADNVYNTNHAAVLYANGVQNYFMTSIEGMITADEAVDGVNSNLTGEEADIAVEENENVLGYVPRGIVGHANAFSAGRYFNSVLCNVVDGSLTVGIKQPGSGNQPEELFFGNIKLIYHGEIGSADAGLDCVLESQRARANTLVNTYQYSSAEDYAVYPNFSEELKEQLMQAMDAIESTSEAEEKYALVLKFSDLFQQVYECKKAYINLMKQSEELANMLFVMEGLLDDAQKQEIDALKERLVIMYQDGTANTEQALHDYVSELSFALKVVDNACEINTAFDLSLFACMVNSGRTDVNAVLTADIEDYTGPVIGSTTVIYAGTFDGQYHKLNYTTTATETIWGLFRSVSGTIKNLHVSGTLYTNINQCGGVVGDLFAGTIENCISSVDIISTFSGDAAYGGFISRTRQPGSVIKDCVFSGTIQGEGAHSCAGISGWTPHAATLTNCLVIGDIMTNSKSGDTFARNSKKVERINCYYLKSYGSVPSDVTQVTEEMLASGEACYLLNGDQSDIQWTQTIGEESTPKPFPGSVVLRDENGVYYNLGNAIETVESDESKAVEIYNTMGQKVAKATKGIYLINGKKVLFK